MTPEQAEAYRDAVEAFYGIDSSVDGNDVLAFYASSLAQNARHLPEVKALETELTRLRARVAELEGELERRDRNETRNCINWGPCSMHDGPMTEPEASHD